jgi:class 3 adenylate cyclase/predicted ATPase
MQQIADWLKTLGMSEYAQRFAENGIDFSVLPHLTEQDLKDIGVLLGHRRKILAAIAEMTGVAPAMPAPTAATELKPQDTAERRQVTVMFSDLVGSTALSARMDPEDLRDVISAYQKCVTQTVQRFGGFVAKYMGDGVLIYFGYPQAHEDDAERAVRAGLELVSAVGALKTHALLRTRVGIATGLVVVGDLIGSGSSQEQAIVGETPNLAARLQSIVEPNIVVIAESTRKLVGSMFELSDLGPQEVKGIRGVVRAWAALRPASVESRFDALHGSGLTELVGREEELELLLRRWAKAKAGEGQVVLLSGEPGIGKSRLTAALMERLAAEPHTRLRYFCSPQHTDSALFPIISQMERAAGFAHNDTVQVKLDKLDALLKQSSITGQDAALFSEMLSLPNDGRYPTLELAPQQRRQRTQEALATRMEILSRSNPVLMIFEDVHWVDPTSLEALGRTVDRMKRLGVLLIVTYRPEFDPSWIGRPYVTAITLNRLGEREIAALIDRVTGNKSLSESIRQDIIERTDGIPLFVEEMTSAVLEAESDDAAQQTAAAVPSSALTVPASLHASLMARLDRLGSAKEIAQIGAAIGREFSHSLLAAVAGKPDAEIQPMLDRLIAAGLLFKQGEPPHATYLFKHALVQDAAYGTLLRSSRQHLHESIAGTLEEEFSDAIEIQPELLARHCAEAGLEEHAIKYWRLAGERAVHRASNREAIRHFRQALALIEKQPRAADRLASELAILSQLGPALMTIHGWTAPDVGIAFERAERLARELERSKDLAPPLAGLWLYHTARGQFSRADEITQELFKVAEALGDPEILLQAHHCAWPVHWFRGALRQAKAHVDAGLGLYQEARHVTHRFLYLGHDPAVCGLSIRSVLQCALGYPEQSIEDEHDAISLARRLKHLPSLAHALWFVCQAQILRNDADAASKTAHELLALSEEHGLPQTRAAALVYLGWAMAQADDALAGIQSVEQGLTKFNQLGVRTNLCLMMCLSAETYFKAKQYDQAVERANLAITNSSEIGDRWCLPRIHAVKAHLHDTFHAIEKAEGSLLAAIEIATEQSAKGSQLPVVIHLARLWQSQGKVREARELLAPVYGWFTEGFGTRDLKEAKALLEELAA